MINPFALNIYLVILLTVCHTILMILVRGEFGIGSSNDPLVDIFLYSHHLSDHYCINIVGKILSWSFMGVRELAWHRYRDIGKTLIL